MTTVHDERLREDLGGLAKAPVLLVGCDYDGTLSELVDDPDAAHPHREAFLALQKLAQVPNTHVAIVSGRSLESLAAATGSPEGILLVGSHGSEFDVGFAAALSEEAASLRDEGLALLHEVAASDPGYLVESKPAGAAFHYRLVDAERAVPAVAALSERLGARDGVHLRPGKMVLEFSVVPTDKGTAIEALRRRFGASAALYLGDDLTDEDAFATLHGPDVGIKVGPGETRAGHRVGGPGDVAQWLAHLSERREAEWLGASAVPIEAHSMLSDQRSLALVDPEGSIVWACAPRLDSPALFAELLGGPSAGAFRIRPTDASEGPAFQRYLDDCLVLETSWKSVRVLDYLDCSEKRTRRRAGRSDFVRVIEGEGEVEIEFAPRLDFGRMDTSLEIKELGLRVEGSLDPIVLAAPGVTWTLEQEGRHQTARAKVRLEAGTPLVLELRYGITRLDAPLSPEADRRHVTARHWSDWVSGLRLPPVSTSAVRRSALVLKGLCYGPTGAIAAAATTSLPETPGGVRNWDYRFSWLRDAAMTAEALLELGSANEAMQYLDWVLTVLDRSPSAECLRPLYTVTGHELGSEGEIAELSGYAGSRPVRVGNGAAQQVQLDVFGPIVDLVWGLIVRDSPVSTEHWRLVEQMAQAVEARWEEPDHGIWEIRKPRRHHVHSKVMCWMTADRTARIAPHFDESQAPRWQALADRIAAEILHRGYNEQRGAFTAAYDSDDLDAAALFVGLAGLIPGDDPRFQSTVRAIESELRDGPAVYRYRTDDGLPGEEGGLHICASWLVESYLLAGRRDDAEELFNAYASLAGPTGLLSEEYSPPLGLALGNHPQAYSHLGLVRNAVRLARTDRQS